MSETHHHHESRMAAPGVKNEPVNAELEAARAKAEAFILEEAAGIAKIVGLEGVHIKVGKKWTTDMKTGTVTVDPGFFIEHGFKPEWALYGVLHELKAHVAEIIDAPEVNRQAIALVKRGKPYSVFHNIFADISGNKQIHARLPKMDHVARDMYSQKLFPEGDYTQPPQGGDSKLPRHLQFLYATIRQEMIPGSTTLVDPEVQAAIDNLRNYQGSGQDVIKISTQVAKTATEKMQPAEKMWLWKEYILPVFEELLEKDKQDPNYKPEPGEPGEPGEGEPVEGEQFNDYYKDYDSRHPDPLTEAQEDALRDYASKKRQERRKEQRQNTPEQRAKKQVEQRTGHSIYEVQRYQRTLNGLHNSIGRMSDFFSTLLDERVSTIRRLSRRSDEGAILNPAMLAQTVADMKSGVDKPQAFLDYERVERERTSEGKFDCYLVTDVSSSMNGAKSIQAAKAGTIFLEGLALFERQIRERETQLSARLNWDVRSSMYTFGDDAKCVKALSGELTEKQRLDAFAAAQETTGGTADFLALQEILANIKKELQDPAKAKRRRIVVVMTDGQSNEPGRLHNVLHQLRALGVHVVGVGIEDQGDAVTNYAPDGQNVEDITTLPDVISNILQSQILQ